MDGLGAEDTGSDGSLQDWTLRHYDEDYIPRNRSGVERRPDMSGENGRGEGGRRRGRRSAHAINKHALLQGLWILDSKRWTVARGGTNRRVYEESVRFGE